MNKSFISFEKEITELLEQVLCDPYLHGLWINTLSYLENCGARKIASCQHPTSVGEEMFKHAAEEFRHAHYLKKQLSRVDQHFDDYRLPFLLGGWSAYHYLDLLDLRVSRYLTLLNKSHTEIKEIAYLVVTYAIELRAGELYPLYQTTLRKHQSKVQVQSILLEEKEHLEEMEAALSVLPEDSYVY